MLPVKSFSRLVASNNVGHQSVRSLYPHYLRYMAQNIPGAKQVSTVEKCITYVGFLVGIMAIPMAVMYDVGKKRPRE